MPPGFYAAADWLSLLGTLGVVVWWVVRRGQWNNEPAHIPFKAIVSLVSLAIFTSLSHRIGFSWGGAFVVPFAAVALGVVLSIAWAPHVGEWLAKPFTSLFDGGGSMVKPQPLYSIAQAKRKKGKFHEAVFAIHQQLQRFPNDVTGQMLLAEIQAENLNDLSGAQVTIGRLCAQPRLAPESIALALTGLADWQLKFGQDIDAARQSLEKIVELLPNSEQAHRAALRIAHLGTTESLLAAQVPERVRLRQGVNNVGLRQESASLQKPAEDSAALTAQYVEHLEQHPLDSDVREKLAVLYAEHYQRLDLAADQLEQLIQQPSHAAKQQAHWLNLLASLHIQFGSDYETVRAVLQRIIDSRPGTAVAALAEQRLARLRLDLKGKDEGQSVKLGSYEQNIGLKNDYPKRSGEREA